MNSSASRGGTPRGATTGSRVSGFVDISVPRTCVGVIIGKNGDMIKKIQQDTHQKLQQDVRIQFKPDDGTSPERLCTIAGTPDSIIMATSFIRNLIAQAKASYGFGCGTVSCQPMNSLGSSLGGSVGSGQGGVSFPVSAHKTGDDSICNVRKAVASVDISVPLACVGVIFATSGDTMKKFQELGVHIQFKWDEQGRSNTGKEGMSLERVCTITGTPDSIIMATSLIRNLIAHSKASNKPGCGSASGLPSSIQQDRFHWNKLGTAGTDGSLGGYHKTGGGNQCEVHFPVPTDICGAVIGKGGESIREIQKVSGAQVQLSKAPPPNPSEKLFIIKGNNIQVLLAQEIISEKVRFTASVSKKRKKEAIAVVGNKKKQKHEEEQKKKKKDIEKPWLDDSHFKDLVKEKHKLYIKKVKGMEEVGDRARFVEVTKEVHRIMRRLKRAHFGESEHDVAKAVAKVVVNLVDKVVEEVV